MRLNVHKIHRTAEHGRLFPTIEVGGGWEISAQADQAGYGCRPKERLQSLGDYETVEILIRGPMPMVDPHNLGLSDDLAGHFPELEPGSYIPSMARDFPVGRLPELQAAVIAAAMCNPNAGIPRGSVTWPGQKVWHGTSRSFGTRIAEAGVDMTASSGGYFGQAFYVTEDEKLARSNYADFSEDEGRGAVLEFTIARDARIIDMRNPSDAAEFTASGLHVSMPDLAKHAVAAGIDGVYDRSMGLAIYNGAVLEFAGMDISPEDEDPEPI